MIRWVDIGYKGCIQIVEPRGVLVVFPAKAISLLLPITAGRGGGLARGTLCLEIGRLRCELSDHLL